MRAALRPVLVMVGATVLLVSSGVEPAAAAVIAERRDTVQVGEVECQVVSRQQDASDETVTVSTGSSSVSGTDSEVCFWGAVEARVRYTYRDADGELQSGEAVAPRAVNITLPSAGITELWSYHRVTYFDGTTSPEFTLPK